MVDLLVDLTRGRRSFREGWRSDVLERTSMHGSPQLDGRHDEYRLIDPKGADLDVDRNDLCSRHAVQLGRHRRAVGSSADRLWSRPADDHRRSRGYCGEYCRLWADCATEGGHHCKRVRTPYGVHLLHAPEFGRE